MRRMTRAFPSMTTAHSGALRGRAGRWTVNDSDFFPIQRTSTSFSGSLQLQPSDSVIDTHNLEDDEIPDYAVPDQAAPKLPGTTPDLPQTDAPNLPDIELSDSDDSEEIYDPEPVDIPPVPSGPISLPDPKPAVSEPTPTPPSDPAPTPPSRPAPTPLSEPAVSDSARSLGGGSESWKQLVARQTYNCGKCDSKISMGQAYFKDPARDAFDLSNRFCWRCATKK